MLSRKKATRSDYLQKTAPPCGSSTGRGSLYFNPGLGPGGEGQDDIVTPEAEVFHPEGFRHFAFDFLL